MNNFLKECVKAQEAYCEEKNKPMFLPLDGRCDHCNRPLFGGFGMTLDQAGSELITGCPYCRHSFCE